MRNLILIILTTVSFGISFANKSHEKLEADLLMLDKEIDMVKQYDKIKFNRIDSIKQIYRKTQPSSKLKIKAALKLGKEYESFMSDSASTYYRYGYNIAIKNSDSIGILNSRIGLAKVLGISGLFKEAVEILDDIQAGGIPDSVEEAYYDCGRQVYSYMTDYANDNPEFSKKYFNKDREFRNLMFTKLDKNSTLYKFYYSEELEDQGKLRLSREYLQKILQQIPENSPLSARVTSKLAGLAASEDNPEEAAHYYILSAISDIRASVKENTSLQNLAIYLYSIGEIDRAYRYISVSMNDANFCNSRLRNSQIARNIPLINNAYQSKIEAQQRNLVTVIVIVSILSIILVIAVILIMIQIKKLNATRKSLRQANNVKEEYMGHFLELCSIYMERLESFNKTVMRKVSTGQIDDLMKMTKSPKFTDEQNKLFYENFDSAFLHIYPTFVEDFNALLLPNEQIAVKEIGKLTMELRIYAFLRMGIDDSNKIASFLHYSVNTVYAYRNKIRNKAVNRATFDKDIMNIGYPKEEE